MIPIKLPSLDSQTISRLDMIAYANVIKDWAFDLSHRANSELIEPLSKILGDPDMLSRWKVYEAEGYDWASLKRQQRDFDRRLQAERLRLYWQEKKRLEAFRKEAGAIIGSFKDSEMHKPTFVQNCKCANTCLTIPNSLFEIFSPIEKHRKETMAAFQKLAGQPIISILPWREALLPEILAETTLNDLPQIISENHKADLAGKFINLLHMQSEGIITLSQEDHFGEITISPELQELPDSAIVTISNQGGDTQDFDFLDLSAERREAILNGIKEHELIVVR